MGKGPLPRVVGERRRRRVVVEPPGWEGHPWASGGLEDDNVYLRDRCLDDIIGHCKDQADKGVEAMGFLAGGVFSWKGRPYTVARDAVTTALEASAVSVRFDRNGFPDLFESLDGLGYDYILVGWYHSHPDYGCFMSGTDQHTQSTGFSEPFHVALVVDPVREEMKAFRSTGPGDGHDEVAIGVFSMDAWPWPGSGR